MRALLPGAQPAHRGGQQRRFSQLPGDRSAGAGPDRFLPQGQRAAARLAHRVPPRRQAAAASRRRRCGHQPLPRPARRARPVEAAAAVPGVGTTAARTSADMATVDFTRYAMPALEQLDGVRVDIVGEKPDYQELTEAPELDHQHGGDGRERLVRPRRHGQRRRPQPCRSATCSRRSARRQTHLLLRGRVLLLAGAAGASTAAPAHRGGPGAAGQRNRRCGSAATRPGCGRTWRSSASRSRQAARVARAGRGPAGDSTAVGPDRLPAGLHAELRPYQREGFDWLRFLWRHRLGGVLADDMGLGKTLQTLALICHAQASRRARDGPPFLVVAPDAACVSNWAARGRTVRARTCGSSTHHRHAARAAAGARRGRRRRRRRRHLVHAVPARRRRLRSAADWAGLVLDEAQFVKNHASEGLPVCAATCRAPFKLAITGTPMENNLMELWSLLSIVAPGLFPTRTRVPRALRAADRDATSDAERLAATAPPDPPAVLRRTKEQVAPRPAAEAGAGARVELDAQAPQDLRHAPAARAAEGARADRRPGPQPVHHPRGRSPCCASSAWTPALVDDELRSRAVAQARRADRAAATRSSPRGTGRWSSASSPASWSRSRERLDAAGHRRTATWTARPATAPRSIERFTRRRRRRCS